MDIAEVKTCLRALLSSSAFSYTLKPLLYDFKSMTGFDLPLFGCKDPVEFLQTLTDTVQLFGNHYNPTVALVVSEKSSHITSLVERQRNRLKGSHSYKCMPPRLIISLASQPANYSKYNFNCNNSSQFQNNCAPKTDHQRGSNSDTYGYQNSFCRSEDQRNNYINIPVTTKCHSNYPSSNGSNSQRNQQQNHYQSLTYEPHCSQNNAKDSLNKFQEVSHPMPITSQTSQPDKVCGTPKTSQNNSQETEKTDSCYFEDFSDIDSCLSGENNKAPSLQTIATTRAYINDKMKDKLQRLIKKYPEGLWCCELPDSFFKEYNVELDYREFGCTSLIEMLSELPDVFRCIRPGNEDWIVFDASAPPLDKEKKLMKLQESGNITSDVANNLHQLLLAHSFENGVELMKIPNLYKLMFDTPLDFQSLGFSSLKTFLETYEGSLLNISDIDNKVVVKPIAKTEALSLVPWKEALPPITKDDDIFKEIFPSDVVGPEGCYPVLDLSLHIAVGQRIEVCVAEVWSPSEFCLQLNKFRKRWTRFATDLQNFYNTHMNRYKMPDATIMPDQLCVGLYSEDPENPDEWNRARVLRVINERTVMVEFVDFGTVARVRKTQLRFLHRNFQNLPIQAFSAALYNVGPKDGNSWSMKASKKFLELSRVSYLVAELIDIDFKKPLLKVILYDTTQNRNININRKLIFDNLGKFMNSKDETGKPEKAEMKTLEKNVKEKNMPEEFSESSDLESDCYTALLHFNRKSRKANRNERQSESEAKKEIKEVIKELDEFEEVPDWNKEEKKPRTKTSPKKKTPEEPDLFEVKEDAPPVKEQPNSDRIVKPEQSPRDDITKRPPPGLERLVEVSRFRMLPFEQPDEIKKRINFFTLELLTTNPSIKEVAVQDPTLALKIASEMAEVYVRWMYCNMNFYGANHLTSNLVPDPTYLVPLTMPFPDSGIFSPIASTPILPTVAQSQPETETITSTDAVTDTPKNEPVGVKESEKSKSIRLITLGGKPIHLAMINGEAHFFAEELIRAFSTFTNRDVADRVLNLKKIVIDYKILNKKNGEKFLSEMKNFEIPGVFKKRSKKWNVYLVPAKIVNTYLQGLGSETKYFEEEWNLQKPSKDSR